MTAIQLRSRHLDSAGAGINALTVEVYATDGDGLPTGAAVASTTTDANGVWEFLAATGLLHSTRYCVKITNGAEVMWLDGSDMIQAEELAVRTKIILPDGNALTASITAILNTLLTTQGDLPYASAANTWDRLAKAAAGLALLRMNSDNTAPEWGTAGQIVFPAAQAASSDANTLDDYEEGTWTPVVGGTATYTTQLGRYTKIGRMVYIHGQLHINSLGTGSTTLISGLPFASANTQDHPLSVSYFAGLAANVLFFSAAVTKNASTIYFSSMAAAGVEATAVVAVLGNGANVFFSGWYEAA